MSARFVSLLNEVDSESGEPTLVKRGLDMTWVDSRPLIYAAVAFSVLSCIVSFIDLREHLSRLDYPKLQVLEMRIILMIPIYAILSAMSLLFMNWRFFLVIIRDTYESFVLYIFFMLMIAYCGGEGQLLRALKAKRYKGMHPFPMCWLPSYPLDTAFYLRCKRWVLQCALVKPICSFLAMVGAPAGIYRESHFTYDNLYTYTAVILNFSLTWALYYLVLFEIECGKEMHYAKVFLKFLCIKSIIFFSYWQSIMVSLAASAGILYLGSDDKEHEKISALIQDLLMCFELLPVAFLHRAAFGRDKLDEEMAAVPVYMKDNNSGNFRSNVDTALNVNDIIDDTIATIFFRKGKLVDQENDSDNDDPYGGADGSGTGTAAGAAAAAAGEAAHRSGDAEAFARDPTLEDLVRHAITSDYGVRVDGVRHYDDDEEREDRNQDMNFTDTDIILHRSKLEAGGSEVRVDTDLLRSKQAQSAGFGGTPQIYCVVCGRFDREMVRRRNGYKCKDCVGTKSQSLLRTRQKETTVGESGGDVAIAMASGKARRGGRLGCSTKALGIETIDNDGGDDSRRDDSDDGSDDDDHFIQPIENTGDPTDAAEGAGGEAPNAAAAAIAEGFSNFQNLLRNTFIPGDGGAAATATVGGGGGGSGGAPPGPSPTCRQCSQNSFMVPVEGDQWRCTNCMSRNL